MAYTQYAASKPVISDSRLSVVDYARTNALALLHMILGGTIVNEAWVFAITAGANDKPTEITLTASSPTRRLKVIIGYETGTHYANSFAVSYAPDGVTYDAIGTATLSYTGTTPKEVTGGNAGSFLLARLAQAYGMLRQLWTAVSDHAALTGASAHGLGTISTQGAGAVAITGGTINGTSLGATTPAAATFTRASEQSNAYTPGASAGVTVDWSKGASSIQHNGTNALTFSNIPGSVVATHLLYVTNLNAITFPSSVTWGASGKPSTTGIALVSLITWFGPSPGASQIQATCVWRAS